MKTDFVQINGLYLVGTGRGKSIEKFAKYFAKYKLSISMLYPFNQKFEKKNYLMKAEISRMVFVGAHSITSDKAPVFRETLYDFYQLLFIIKNYNNISKEEDRVKLIVESSLEDLAIRHSFINDNDEISSYFVDQHLINLLLNNVLYHQKGEATFDSEDEYGEVKMSDLLKALNKKSKFAKIKFKEGFETHDTIVLNYEITSKSTFAKDVVKIIRNIMQDKLIPMKSFSIVSELNEETINNI